jgi:hypothetical protein
MAYTIKLCYIPWYIPWYILLVGKLDLLLQHGKYHGIYQFFGINHVAQHYTLQADVEMLYIKETVFGVQDGGQLIDSMHPCLVALARR